MEQEIEAQTEIVALLLECSRDRELFGRKLETLADRYGGDIYATLLFTVTHLDFSGEDAASHWKGILAHWERMSRLMEKAVDLRVVILDYFVDIGRQG